MLNNFFFWLAIVFLIGFIIFAIWDDNAHNEGGGNAIIYISLCACICVFMGVASGEQGEVQGAYNQMRGKYEVTYKTTIIVNGDNETKRTDTIIHVE